MNTKIRIPAAKHRAHRVLWDRDLPFRPKSERNRVLYRRNIKHKLKNPEFDQ